MAQAGFTPISLYFSSTAAAVPIAGNLANGELALNIADMKLYAKNSAGAVTLLASSGGAAGTVSSVSGTGTVNGLTLTGTVTTSGSLTLGGTLSLVSPPPIGSTTPNTGAFTTLSASGTTTLGGNQIISVTDNTNAALRITQTGTGNALLVEDSANPDSTPFVIDANGRVVVGNTLPYTFAGTITPFTQLLGTTSNSGLVTGRWAASTGDSSIKLVKSRSTTIGTNGVVSSGDNLGNISFEGDDGTAFIQAATITSSVDGTPGTSDMPGRLVFSTTADGASSPTERVRIASTGAIGLSGANYGIAGQVLTSGGSGAAPTWASVGGGSGFTAKTANYTAASGDNILANTSAGSWTLTLPASPSTGNSVQVMDSIGTFGQYPLTVARNGQTIMSASENMILDVNGAATTFVYNGSTWRVI